MDKSLSILIPARNEEFLQQTLDNILENIEADTEIIVALDGYNTPLKEHPKVKVIKFEKSIGQRAATNKAAELSKAKYVMKTDAHVSFSKGFDRILMEDMKDSYTMMPLMRNLWAFDWICPDGHRHYQDQGDVCDICKKHMIKDIKWIGKSNPQSWAFRFDKNMHFQYYREYKGSKDAREGSITGYKLSFDTRSISPEVIKLLADLARSHHLTCSRNTFWFGKNVTMNTVDFSSVNNSGSFGTGEILGIGNKSQMEGITTNPIITNMVNNSNIPTSTTGNAPNESSIEDTMCECFLSEISAPTITPSVNSTNPIPTSTGIINSNFIDKFNNILGGQFIYSEKTNSYHNGSVTLTTIHNKGLVETMTIPGSCFMVTREKYFELDLCDEKYGSWGQQGVEVSCKTWLSGGRVMVDKRCWYAHMFRTTKYFSFPWPASGSSQEKTREMTKDIFMGNQWPKAIHKFQWLLDKFNPPGWEETTKGIVYYTDNQLNEKILKRCQENLMKLESSNLPIISISLKSIEFGENYVLPLERGLLTMTKQIIKGLEMSTADVIFFCEHDVLYHPSHFKFTPPKKDVYYYNMNSWMYRAIDGHCLFYDHKSLSGLCAYRITLLKHFKERKKRIEALIKEANGTGIVKSMKSNLNISLREGIHRLGFEPGTHNRVDKIDELKSEGWESLYPNVDIKHEHNWTRNRWSIDQFRNKPTIWKEADEVPFWGKNFL